MVVLASTAHLLLRLSGMHLNIDVSRQPSTHQLLECFIILSGILMLLQVCNFRRPWKTPYTSRSLRFNDCRLCRPSFFACAFCYCARASSNLGAAKPRPIRFVGRTVWRSFHTLILRARRQILPEMIKLSMSGIPSVFLSMALLWVRSERIRRPRYASMLIATRS